MKSIPAYTIAGITRPELFLDFDGNIILTRRGAGLLRTSTGSRRSISAALPAHLFRRSPASS